MSRSPISGSISWGILPILLLALLALPACSREPADEGEHGHAHSEEPEAWTVTAWSEHYELFAETDPLVAGHEAASHAHFTYLPDFSPVGEGSVVGILRSPDGGEERFVAPEPARPGIFNVLFRPSRQGTFQLAFEVRNPKATEEIAAGLVRVGSPEEPGGPAGEAAAGAAAGEPVSFLKEQQWRTGFATAPARRGSLRESFRAPARVVPPAGGEVVVTAPAAGVVQAARWPHAGMEVGRGAPLFAVTPRVEAERGLSELRADVAELEAELGAARARLARLKELLEVEAVSRREVEEAEVRVAALTARDEAARQRLATAGAVRGGSTAGAERFRVPAPIAGRVAEVTVSPGQWVDAGTPLARLVQTSPVWIELSLRPEQASALAGTPEGLLVRRWAGEEPFPIPGEALRVVSRSPEVDPSSGSVRAVLEVRRGVDVLRLGSRLEVEVLLPREREGVVVPGSALVDDAGVEVVYVQLGGESFERREVTVEARQGEQALVRGIAPGERIVTRGGDAIRRSVLLGSGAAEGHVH